MKKIPILFFLLTTTLNTSFAQDIVQVFLSSNYFPVDSVNAEYIRFMKPIDISSVEIKDYYLSGELHQEGQAFVEYKNLTTYPSKSIKREVSKFTYYGNLVSYFKNGNKKTEGNYTMGKEIGLFTHWYENGNLESEYYYSDTLKSEQKYLTVNFFDSIGTQLVSDGEGVFIKYNGDKLLDSGRVANGLKQGEWIGQQGLIRFRETYSDGRFLEGVSYDSLNNTYYYTHRMVQPEYISGMENFYRLITTNIKYPIDARRKGVQGIVYVQFIVDKSGKITEVKTVRGIGESCDREAERVVSLGKGFKPGLFKGQPAKIKMIMPITFKLG